VLAPAVAGAEGTSGPALDYAVTCQGCHRADGAGTPGTVPALAGSVGRFLRVLGGREFLVRVPGVAQAPLDDAALAAVLNWMLERFGRDDVPEGFVPYAAEEVRRLRQRPLTDVVGARRQLLEAIERAR
jgi:mono/diheme cytochrome c family protein